MLQGMFSQEALLFTIPALLGTAVFLLKLGLMAIGGFAGATWVEKWMAAKAESGASAD